MSSVSSRLDAGYAPLTGISQKRLCSQGVDQMAHIHLSHYFGVHFHNLIKMASVSFLHIKVTPPSLSDDV